MEMKLYAVESPTLKAFVTGSQANLKALAEKRFVWDGKRWCVGTDDDLILFGEELGLRLFARRRRENMDNQVRAEQ